MVDKADTISSSGVVVTAGARMAVATRSRCAAPIPASAWRRRTSPSESTPTTWPSRINREVSDSAPKHHLGCQSELVIGSGGQEIA